MQLLGVRVPGPVSMVRSLLSPLAPPRRRAWSCEGRLHIEGHGVSGVGGRRTAERIERELEKAPGVKWARVNAPSARVIVATADPAPRSADLIEVLERAESEPDPAEDELHHPADGPRATKLLPTLAADALGLGLSLITKLAPWMPLPTEPAALPGLVNQHPKLRQVVAERVGGHERADSLASITGALAHGLAAGSEGTLIDTAQRVEQWREAREHEKAWCRAEAGLIDGPDSAAAEPIVTERPQPLPEDPVARYARRVLNLGAAATAVMLPFGPRRAMGLGLAAQPKAAEAGRAAFGAHLGRVLAGHDVVVMDRSVLRRLDTMDVLVIDEDSFGDGRFALDEVVPVEGNDPREIAERAWRLFDARKPGEVR